MTTTYQYALAEAVIVGLKTYAFPSCDDNKDGRHWGIGILADTSNRILSLREYIDKKWVKKVERLQRKENSFDDNPSPQLRIQYDSGTFYIFLECNIGKYDGRDAHTITEISESRLRGLLEKLILRRNTIYDQYGDSIFN